MADLPKRVWSGKSQVYSGKKPIWEKDGKVGVYSPNFEEVEGGETYAVNRWEDLPDTAELQVYGKDSFEGTDIGTFEDGLEATYTFMNYNESVLKTGKVKDGETPVAPADPTKPATAQYTYTFSGWNPAVGPITKNTSYIAQYTSTVNTYTITFKDYDNSVISEQTLEYGASPVVPSDPTRSGYRFTGWSPAVVAVTGDATYTAQYVQQFVVTIEPNDSSMGYVSINSVTVDSGTEITTSDTTLYVGDTEVVATAESGYVFDGWTISPGSTVTSATTCTAVFISDTPMYLAVVEPEQWGTGDETYYPQEVYAPEGSSITNNGDGTITINETTIAAVPAKGYGFNYYNIPSATLDTDPMHIYVIFEKEECAYTGWQDMSGQLSGLINIEYDETQQSGDGTALFTTNNMYNYQDVSARVIIEDQDYAQYEQYFATHIGPNPETSNFECVLSVHYSGPIILDNLSVPIKIFLEDTNMGQTVGVCYVTMSEPTPTP